MPALDRSLVDGMPMFAGLGPQQLDDVLAPAKSVRFQKGATVFEQDSEATCSSSSCTAISRS